MFTVYLRWSTSRGISTGIEARSNNILLLFGLNEMYFIYNNTLTTAQLGRATSKITYTVITFTKLLTLFVLFVDIVCRCDRCLFHITIMSDGKKNTAKTKTRQFHQQQTTELISSRKTYTSSISATTNTRVAYGISHLVDSLMFGGH